MQFLLIDVEIARRRLVHLMVVGYRKQINQQLIGTIRQHLFVKVHIGANLFLQLIQIIVAVDV